MTKQAKCPKCGGPMLWTAYSGTPRCWWCGYKAERPARPAQATKAEAEAATNG